MDPRDTAIATYFSLGMSQNEIVLFLRKCNNIILSKRTLKRRLCHMKLYRRKNYTTFRILTSFLQNELIKSGQLHGYKWMHLKCLQAGLVVQRESVRLALHLLDSDGVAIRKRKRLRRRQYYSKGPNHLWHMDGYDKLKPYGIAIHGCIDGFSRHIIWLNAAYTNNDPAVIGGYFIDAVDSLGGCPKIVRCDRGTENKYIEQMQTFFAERDSLAEIVFIYGKSTSNQKIEAWWSILRKHMSQFWINLFETIRDDGYFDGSFLDKSVMQFSFMNLINEELDTVCLEWNSHRISSSRNSILPKGKPTVLFECPELYGALNCLIPLSQENILRCKEECKYIQLPCDEIVYDLCTLIMEEANLTPPKDPYEAVQIYKTLREELLLLL